MSQSRSDQGQSMEEILASIRRIIAEGERDMPGFDPKRPGAAEPSPAVDTRPPWSRPETSPPSDMPADVLVLTEMVQEDGTVVSLEAEPVVSTPSAESTEIGITEAPRDLAAEHPAQIAEAPASEPTPVTTDESGHIALSPVDAGPEEVLRSIAAGLAVEKSDAMDELVGQPPQVEQPAATALAYPPVEQAGGIFERGATPAAVPAAPTQEMEKSSVSGEGLKKPELVSEETLAASTAALAQLAQSVGRTREVSPGQSQTVEELVRGAVEPMLKQWLDANLSRIVERMVREAIDRVVRRVE